MLDVLGLGVSEGVAVDDDELWEAMLSMGIRLIRPSVPVRESALLRHGTTGDGWMDGHVTLTILLRWSPC